jgi:hypothetical protein
MEQYYRNFYPQGDLDREKYIRRHNRRHKTKEVKHMKIHLQGFGKQDLLSLGKGLLIALAGTAITYLYAYITKQNLGVYTPIIMTLAPVIVNILRKSLDGRVE